MASTTSITFPPKDHTHDVSKLTFANIYVCHTLSTNPAVMVNEFPYTWLTSGILFPDEYAYIYNEGTQHNIWFRYSNDPVSNKNPTPSYLSVADIARRLEQLEARVGV